MINHDMKALEPVVQFVRGLELIFGDGHGVQDIVEAACAVRVRVRVRVRVMVRVRVRVRARVRVRG